MSELSFEISGVRIPDYVAFSCESNTIDVEALVATDVAQLWHTELVEISNKPDGYFVELPVCRSHGSYRLWLSFDCDNDRSIVGLEVETRDCVFTLNRDYFRTNPLRLQQLIDQLNNAIKLNDGFDYNYN